MKTVQDKANEMLSEVNNFKQVFKELFEDGLPSFWDEEGRMFSQEHYHSLLVQSRMDHSKFDDLEKRPNRKSYCGQIDRGFRNLTKVPNHQERIAQGIIRSLHGVGSVNSRDDGI